MFFKTRCHLESPKWAPEPTFKTKIIASFKTIR